MNSVWIIIGAISGLITVGIGAFGAHGLKEILENNQTTNVYNKAVLYQMFHSIAILIIGLLEMYTEKSIFLSGLFLTLGILIFSGSLYVLSITNLKWIGAITPIGGLCFLIGWIILVLFAIRL
mgnify:CR=1 FL=1